MGDKKVEANQKGGQNEKRNQKVGKKVEANQKGRQNGKRNQKVGKKVGTKVECTLLVKRVCTVETAYFGKGVKSLTFSTVELDGSIKEYCFIAVNCE